MSDEDYGKLAYEVWRRGGPKHDGRTWAVLRTWRQLTMREKERWSAVAAAVRQAYAAEVQA
jgi:hypothetical protein